MQVFSFGYYLPRVLVVICVMFGEDPTTDPLVRTGHIQSLIGHAWTDLDISDLRARHIRLSWSVLHSIMSTNH
jgi:hypothetical protein